MYRFSVFSWALNADKSAWPVTAGLDWAAICMSNCCSLALLLTLFSPKTAVEASWTLFNGVTASSQQVYKGVTSDTLLFYLTVFSRVLAVLLNQQDYTFNLYWHAKCNEQFDSSNACERVWRSNQCIRLANLHIAESVCGGMMLRKHEGAWYMINKMGLINRIF